MDQNVEFQEELVKGGRESLEKVMVWIRGGKEGSPIIKGAEKMLGLAVKVMHMQQIAKNTDKSLALRLLKFLPDEKTRREYIKLTNPEVKPLLLDRPKKG